MFTAPMKTVRTLALAGLFAFGVALPAAAQNTRTESYKGREVVSGEILVRFRAADIAQSRALAAQDADIASIEQAGGAGAILLRSRGRDVTTLLQTYQARPDVMYAEPNYLWYASDIPNDLFFNQQYGLLNTGQTLQTPGTTQTGTAGADISARQAWDITEGSRAIVVAVIDTGVDYTHPDLADNVWSAPRSFTVTINGQTITCGEGTHGFNAITRTCDPRDDNGHGTHVSGIIGASGNNGAGVSGVNRIGSIIGSKFLGSGGSGSTVDAIAALDFLVQVKTIFPAAANVRVLNNSWGGGAYSQSLLDEINLAAASEMLFVASAGNSALNNDLSNVYPASYTAPNVIAVAATDNRDALASFSDWGPVKVHLGAPGVNVFSTWPSGAYAFLSGTSMAAPMVSGAAGLLLSACPLTTSALKSDLLNSVDPIPALAGKTVTGGRLNLFRALTTCAGTAPAALTLTVTPGAPKLDLNASVNLTVTATSTAGVNLVAFGLPTGVTAAFTPSFIPAGMGSSTLQLTASAAATEGVFLARIAGTSGAVSRGTGVLLTVGSPPIPISVGQTIAGTLAAADPVSQERTGKHADFYKLTLIASTAVTIDLKSRIFDPFLYLLSASGTILFSDDQSGGSNNARITQTLGSGTYLIEVTTFLDGARGDYTLSINTPTISAIAPGFGGQGSTVTVRLTGARFSSPMTVSAGSGITVSNVTVASATSATVTLAIASNAAFTPRDLTVSTPEGTSNPVTFAVPTPINVGERISGTLATTDRISQNSLYRYSDLYQFTVNSSTSVTIDMRSTTVDTFLYLFSATGSILLSDNDSGGGANARITATLAAGTYFVEATSLPTRATGDYTLSINLPVLASITPVFLEQGQTTAVTITGSRFAAPMTIDAGAGISVGNVNVSSATAATATFTIAANASIGLRDVTATTSEGAASAATVPVVPPIPSIALGQTVAGTLSVTDPLTALTSTPAYADLYKIGPFATSTPVTITLRSTVFDTQLSLWTAAGLFAANNDSGASSNSRITITLSAGVTYFVEVSSFLPRQPGDYTLLVSPLALSFMTPTTGVQGGAVTVTLIGNRFIAPMTIDAGSGIVAGNINIPSVTFATATLTIAAAAPLGVHEVTVTTSEGTTNAVTFTVFPSVTSIPSIGVGETLSGTLAAGDQSTPHRTGQYADFYRLTVTTTTPVYIDMKSTAFNTYLFLLSSSGSVLFSDDDSGGSNNARVGATLAAGTYLIEATSSFAGIGNYTVSVATAPPLITALTPAYGAPGRAVSVTLTGQFFVAPTTVDAGVGITVTGVTLASSTTATAVFTIGPAATVGDRNVTVTSAYGTGAALPFTVTSQSVLNFPRLLTPSDLATTGFAIVNPGPTPAAVTFTMYNSTGLQVSVSTQTVPARGQFSKLGSELFAGATQSGWVQATSATVGLQALWIGGDFTNFMDGADSGPIARELILPLVVLTNPAEISVANIGSGPNTVTFRLYGTAGTEISTPANVTLPPNGVYKNLASTIFPFITATPMYIRATGTRNITGTSVTSGYPFSPSWTVLNGIDTARSFTEIDFPHVPSGPQDGSPAWTSILGVTNLSATTTQAVTITFTPNTGSPVSTTRFLSAYGSLRDSVQSLFGFSSAYQEGWVKVTGSAPLNGFIAYGFSGTNGATAVAGQSTPRSSMIFGHVANGPQWGTGLALLNNTSIDANVEVFIMRRTGDLVGSQSFTLPRGTKRANLLTELVPASNADDGFVYVRTTNNVPLYGIQLFFSRDNKVIANIPAVAIDPTITYTPPAAP